MNVDVVQAIDMSASRVDLTRPPNPRSRSKTYQTYFVINVDKYAHFDVFYFRFERSEQLRSTRPKRRRPMEFVVGPRREAVAAPALRIRQVRQGPENVCQVLGTKMKFEN